MYSYEGIRHIDCSSCTSLHNINIQRNNNTVISDLTVLHAGYAIAQNP